MIYTITLNPSVDHYIFIDRDITAGATNRAKKTNNVCGGKGINVGIVCGQLGVPAVCTGFCGGFTGDELIRQLDENGTKHRFVRIRSNTRINTKIVRNGTVTEINAEAPDITEEEAGKLLDVLSGMKRGDTAVLSGSVPDTPGLLTKILEVIKASGARFMADTSGDALKECIRYRPFLIKPNRAELAALFVCGADNMDIPGYAAKLLSDAENVIVSDGERGAYYVNKRGCVYLPAKDAGYEAKNATGAGDSMIAGWLYGELTGADPFVCAVCAGCASAYSEYLFDKSIFETVIKTYICV